jgi:hypothetical protein
MGIRLWLDDKRAAPPGWVHARNARQAIDALKTQAVDEASLDHDLGHCDECKGCNGYKSQCGCECHWSGHTVVLFMITTGRWPAAKPRVHSANPVGAENMRAAIDRYFPDPSAAPCEVAPEPPGLRFEFRFSFKEQASAVKFQKTHYRRCRPLGAKDTLTGKRKHAGFQYRFTPTGIGDNISIKCLACRKVRNITDYDQW